jgi:hypothetical protein
VVIVTVVAGAVDVVVTVIVVITVVVTVIVGAVDVVVTVIVVVLVIASGEGSLKYGLLKREGIDESNIKENKNKILIVVFSILFSSYY